jgi:hypothetical protein
MFKWGQDFSARLAKRDFSTSRNIHCSIFPNQTMFRKPIVGNITAKVGSQPKKLMYEKVGYSSWITRL